MEKLNSNLKKVNRKNILYHRDLINFNLVPYFNLKENIEFSKINSYFHKGIKRYFQNWEKELKNELSVKFNLDLENSNIIIDLTKLEAIKNQRGFLIKGTKANYIQFLLDGHRQFALTRGEAWAHYDNTKYWEKCKFSNGSFGGESYHLKIVCWLDLSLNFYNVKTDVYDVFLRQALNLNHNMEDQLTLKIVVFTENREINIYEEQFMNKHMIDSLKKKFKNSSEKLNDCKITKIDLTKYTNQKECKVSISFWHKTGLCKNGWYIDGAFLEKHN